MTNQDNPIFRINEKYQDLFTKEKELADIVLEDPNKIMHFTINELAAETGVSVATIVRFCKQIGYKGYSEFKLEIAKSSYSLSEREENNSREDHKDMCLSQELYDGTLEWLNAYAKEIDYESIQKIAGDIYDSNLVLVYGQNETGHLAHLFVEKLKATGKASIYATDRISMKKLSLIDSANAINIFVSNTGSTNVTVESAIEAKRKGNKVVVLTKSDKSRLAKLADDFIALPFYKRHLLEFSFQSQIGFILILDLIASEVLQLQKEKEGEEIQKYRDELYRDSHYKED